MAEPLIKVLRQSRLQVRGGNKITLLIIATGGNEYKNQKSYDRLPYFVYYSHWKTVIEGICFLHYNKIIPHFDPNNRVTIFLLRRALQ